MRPADWRQAVGEELGQRRLALAVLAEERDAVVLVDAKVEVGEDRPAAVADADVLEANDRRRELLGGGEVEAGDAVLDDGGNGLHPLQRLDAALRLAGLGRLGAETVDEGLHVGAGGVLLLLLGEELLEAGAAGVLEGVVGALVEGQLLAVEMEDGADRAVEEVAIVADDQHGVGVAGEEGLEPDRALEVEVVGGLVEKKDVRPGEEHGGECDAHPPAAGELGAGTALRLGVEAEAVQDRGGAGLGGMGVDVGEAGVDLGDAVGVAGVLGLGHQCGAFGVGGKHGVEEAVAGRRRLLGDAADAGALGHLDLAAVERGLAADQPEERGLAAAVASDEPDLVPGGDRRRGIVEELLALDREGDVADRQHGSDVAWGPCLVNRAGGGVFGLFRSRCAC